MQVYPDLDLNKERLEYLKSNLELLYIDNSRYVLLANLSVSALPS